MQTLLTVLVAWLSINFGLPAVDEHPRVEFATPTQMAEIRYSRVEPEAERPAPAEFGHHFQAIYDDSSRTIYLPEDWTGATPADVSVLVHELVHHLQNVGGETYPCAGAREKPAYRAQARWLEMFGTSLEDEFQIDPMTILVRTTCTH